MKRFTINYFGEKLAFYSGDTVEEAILYAESYEQWGLVASYVGEITVSDECGVVLASQKWTESEDGSSSPAPWKIM